MVRLHYITASYTISHRSTGDSLMYHLGSRFRTSNAQNETAQNETAEASMMDHSDSTEEYYSTPVPTTNSISPGCLSRGGWWVHCYFRSNLNGEYSARAPHGVVWSSLTGWYDALRWTEMKIRPFDF